MKFQARRASSFFWRMTVLICVTDGLYRFGRTCKISPQTPPAKQDKTDHPSFCAEENTLPRTQARPRRRANKVRNRRHIYSNTTTKQHRHWDCQLLRSTLARIDSLFDRKNTIDELSFVMVEFWAMNSSTTRLLPLPEYPDTKIAEGSSASNNSRHWASSFSLP